MVHNIKQEALTTNDIDLSNVVRNSKPQSFISLNVTLSLEEDTMTAKGLHITERDIEVLNFINQFGFCEMPHLNKRFDWKKPRNYQIGLAGANEQKVTVLTSALNLLSTPR